MRQVSVRERLDKAPRDGEHGVCQHGVSLAHAVLARGGVAVALLLRKPHRACQNIWRVLCPQRAYFDAALASREEPFASPGA